MNLRSTIVNEYTVGGSLLLVGFGFFSTRFADILSYRVATVPSMIPYLGGKAVTVGRILGVVPATLGLAVLLRKAQEVPVVREVIEVPVVKTVVQYVDDLNEDITSQIEIVPGDSGMFPIPGMNAEEMAAEEALFCAEHDDYYAACGCGSKAADFEYNVYSQGKKIDSGKMTAKDRNAAMQSLEEGGQSDEEFEVTEVKAKTSGSPKQQAWRSCVRDAKGDMAKAKQMYKAMGY
jgi:hypothetical protein